MCLRKVAMHRIHSRHYICRPDHNGRKGFSASIPSRQVANARRLFHGRSTFSNTSESYPVTDQDHADASQMLARVETPRCISGMPTVDDVAVSRLVALAPTGMGSTGRTPTALERNPSGE